MQLKDLRKTQITPKFFRSLPETAGVYLFFNKDLPIYIGKAINIRRRVSSYFDLELDRKTGAMVREAKYLSFIQVNSELEALLLEAKLIRTFMPKYNIAAKDDKHPLYIRITEEEYPRIITARKISINEDNLAFYGPFPSSTNVRSVLKMLRRIFPYSDHKIGPRPCLYSHIGLCNPCPNQIIRSANREILKKQYLSNIKMLKSTLDGNFSKVGRDLEKKMKLASTAEDFETAITTRKQIESFEYIKSRQIPTESYLINPNFYQDIRNKELSDLEKLSGIKKIKRIECFDIAHLSGTFTTASMVTFIDGEAEKKYYRHFRIRQRKGNSDYDSMSEVAKRRFSHFDDWGRPDLIIVDGGIGQVNSFAGAVKNSDIGNIKIVGIAKHPDRLIVGDKRIKLTGNALNLVSRMRDEAHRFARRYHHSLISKSIKNAVTS